MYLAVKHVKKTSYNDIQVLHYLNTKTWWEEEKGWDLKGGNSNKIHPK